MSTSEENDIENMPYVTNSMKWWLALFLGALFFLLALPYTYQLINMGITGVGLPSVLTGDSCPTVMAVLINAILFVLIIRLILW